MGGSGDHLVSKCPCQIVRMNHTGLHPSTLVEQNENLLVPESQFGTGTVACGTDPHNINLNSLTNKGRIGGVLGNINIKSPDLGFLEIEELGLVQPRPCLQDVLTISLERANMVQSYGGCPLCTDWTGDPSKNTLTAQGKNGKKYTNCMSMTSSGTSGSMDQP